MKKEHSSKSKGRPGLKELREKAGLTQLQLAAQIPVDPTAVRAWENSGAIPALDKAVKLARVLQVPLKRIALEFGIDVDGIPNEEEEAMVN